VLQLVVSKCLPILLYGSEACGLNKADIHSLDFAVTRSLMKLFKTANYCIIKDCLKYFEFKLPSVLIIQRTRKFMPRYDACGNFFASC
jgi:hypothetical protein